MSSLLVSDISIVSHTVNPNHKDVEILCKFLPSDHMIRLLIFQFKNATLTGKAATVKDWQVFPA